VSTVCSIHVVRGWPSGTQPDELPPISYCAYVLTVKARRDDRTEGGEAPKGSPEMAKDEARGGWNGKPKGDKKMQKVSH